MPSIKDLLENLSIDDSHQEKTASNNSDKELEQAVKDFGLGLDLNSDKEPTTKTASKNNGGDHMNLQELYQAHFSDDETVKVASIQKTAAEELESAGERARMTFESNLDDRLTKFAMNQEMESAATEANDGSSAVAVPGNTAKSPQLPQDKDEEAKSGKPLDTTNPQYYDMLDKAVAKAKIIKALETNDTDEVEGVSQVDVGLARPASQKDA